MTDRIPAIIFLIADLVIGAACALAQPVARPVAAFFQPASNVQTLTGWGVNTFCGPEVPNARYLSPADLAAGRAAWNKAVSDAGGKVVLKSPPPVLPANCAGVMLTPDEANGKVGPQYLPAAMKVEADAFRAAYPGVPIWLSLAGDKILSANFDKPAEAQLYRDYAALADVLTVDFYSRNRNADRYPDTHTGDIVKKLVALTGKKVLPWIECNDQQLSPPPPGQGSNRAPTPAEIKAQVDYAMAQGACGVGWFATCDSGKYSWPASYLPSIDRNGASMAPQYAMVATLSKALNPTTQPTPPVTQPTNADLQKQLDFISAKLIDLTAKFDQHFKGQ